MRDHAVHINALPYGGITLETELLGPQFRLSHKNQRHGTRGIEFKVQQEPKFFQSFLVKQMSLVQDTDDFLLVVCPNPPDFVLQLVFCFAAVEFRFQAQLPEHPLVKPAWGELGIGKIQQDVLIPAQTVGKLADHGGFPASGIRREHGEKLPVRHIAEPSKNVRGGCGFIQPLWRHVPGEWRMLHAEEVFKHPAHRPSEHLCGSC